MAKTAADRILAWMALGLSHSDNCYISMVKFYKYTLTLYIMLKKIYIQPIGFGL